MRALTYDEYGDVDVLHVAEVDEPHAGPGQVRIRVAAASINPVDWKVVAGMMAGGQPLAAPAVPGADAAGVVDEVGEGVTGVAMGDDVFGTGQGTQAEHAVLRAWARKPPSVDWSVAAAAGVVGETAERMLRLAGVGPGSTVFVDGGAGGVGSVVVQLAVARGITVVASAGQGNADYLREIGATPVPHGEGVADRVRVAAGGQVDAVLDVAGKTPIDALVALVPDPAKVVSIANFSAGEAGAQVTGGGSDSRGSAALAEVAELLQHSRVVIKVQTFPLDRAVEAYRASVGGHVRGKLVLLP